MMVWPEVSVVLTARDASETIAEAVASVLEQSFEDWELIVWDDGSEDSTYNDAHAAGGGDRRVREFHAPATGRNAALRSACDEARGRWLTFLDADDRLAPEALERCLAARENGPVEVIYTDTLLVNAEGMEPSVYRNAWRGDYPEGVLQMQMYRRDAYLGLGGIDPTYEYSMLYDLFLRALASDLHCVRVPEPLYERRLRVDSITARYREGALACARRALEEVRRG